jgi:hypothetical protein
MNRSVFLFLLLPVCIGSCNPARQGNTTVSGCISNASGKLLRLEEVDPEKVSPLDSVILGGSGDFTFNIASKEAGIYLLALPKPLKLILEIRPGDQVRISCAEESYPLGAEISGSGNSSDMMEFFRMTALNRMIYDSLQNVLLSHQGEPDFDELSKKLDESLEPVWERQRALEISYIGKHLQSLTSLLILNQGIGVSPVMSFQFDSVYFVRLDSALNKEFPGNRHTVFHHNRIIQERETQAMQRQSR